MYGIKKKAFLFSTLVKRFFKQFFYVFIGAKHETLRDLTQTFQVFPKGLANENDIYWVDFW